MFSNISNIARTSGTGAASQALSSVSQKAASGIFDKIFGTFTGGMSNTAPPTVTDGSFHVQTAAPHLQDPQRDWMFMIDIIQPRFTDTAITNDLDELIMRAKNFTMPNKTVQTQEVSFYGHKQVIPVDVDYDRSFNITFEESQDQFILRNFNSWLNMFDSFSEVVTDETGTPQGVVADFKTIYKTQIDMYMYRYDGSHEGVKISFYNAYPTSLGGSTFGHDSSSKITYDISFAYDYYKIEKNTLNAAAYDTTGGAPGIPDAPSTSPTGGLLSDALGDFDASFVANFLGLNEGRIRHAAYVLTKWGPIIGLKAGVGAILGAIESNKWPDYVKETYDKPDIEIATDSNRWAAISSDPKYQRQLEF